ncbi:MAG: MiaB/RimO family radical SAM methylthiotransferase, partial [Firmicutes bacterium]|nr:MiaB/RimO family radical SAM methylthiotransferase [Bacillota bacterium]
EGCNNRCSYCLIPQIRGPQRSRPQAEILAETKELLAGGTKEIVLLAQDTTAYGAEWGTADGLSGLLEQIFRAIPHYFWLRILYAHPSRVSDSLIHLIAREERLCKYLDLPLQHINSDLLKSMGRRYSREEVVELVGKLRRHIPGITLRTTCITGYPGEKPAHFRELSSFLKEEPFERVGVFAYSRQRGTSASGLSHQIPRRVAKRRRRSLLTAQQAAAHSFNSSLVGARFTVLVEGPARRDSSLYCGRTSFQAPEVDGLTFFTYPQPLKPGSFVDVLVTAAAPYDLYGKGLGIVEEPVT